MGGGKGKKTPNESTPGAGRLVFMGLKWRGEGKEMHQTQTGKKIYIFLMIPLGRGGGPFCGAGGKGNALHIIQGKEKRG